MVGGATYVVRESLPEVIALIAEFRALVIATAHSFAPGEGPRLSVLRGQGDSGATVEATAAAGTPTATSPTPIRPTER
jgi:flagellar protein FlbD